MPESSLTPEPPHRAFTDIGATRQNIYDDVLGSLQTDAAVTNGKRFDLHLKDVHYIDPPNVPPAKVKEAVLANETLGRRLKGTWALVDPKTGETLDSKKQIIGRVPLMTDMGTFVHNGSQYSVSHQARLAPGIYARRKESGEYESHVNVLKGVSHRYLIDPEKGVFKIKIGQAEIPLAPLLTAMGATPEQLKEAWGPDIARRNAEELRSQGPTLEKLADRLLTNAQKRDTETPTATKLKQRMESMEVDPEVTRRTLGHPHQRLDVPAILAATGKLLKLHRNEAKPDDRDHLAYQTFHGPEDFFSERVRKDHSRIRATALFHAEHQGNLQKLPTGLLTPQLEEVLLGSGLANAGEMINPAETLDHLTKVTRMGEGGIPSEEVIPSSSRDVGHSQHGFIDPSRTTESSRAGVDLFFARGARKGRNGQIYAGFRDMCQPGGPVVYKSPRDLADKTVAFPDALTSDMPRVPAFRGDEMVYVKPHEVDYVLPHLEEGFSPIGNLTTLKSGIKAHRTAMASRMITQALPLENGEAPLVRTALAGQHGGRSFETEYGEHMGAVRAKQNGMVLDATPNRVRVKYDNGEEHDVPLHQYTPLNRKTFQHQSPLVRPGDKVLAGQPIVRSNFTDANGDAALGLNVRTAYLATSRNHEDAISLSEDAAKKFSSHHMYQHGLELDPKHRVGKKPYVSLFPSRFDRDVLDTMDDAGIVKPGTTVQKDQPLILAAKEREDAHNKIHKRKQAGFHDQSIVWDHHDPGVVTDVVWSRQGPVVSVRALAPLRIGDKISDRFGGKGICSEIIPDEHMPRGADGKPFDVLIEPSGAIGRGNPAQFAEGALGEVARKTGKPFSVEDFAGISDLRGYAEEQLKKHGLSDLETVTDPKTGRKIANVPVGTRFFMKLHHQAEGKLQGRGSEGGYDAEGSPSRGGASGSKRIGVLDLQALLSGGAVENLRDASLVRGQKNDDYWLQFMQGHTPREPRTPLAYTKMLDQLKAAGVHVVPEGDQLHFMALGKSDIAALTGGREVKNGELARFDKNFEPIPGGLFSESATGGHGGSLWSSYKLAEPLLSPVMEDPARRLLGLTKKDLEEVIAGRQELEKRGTGPQALAKALDKINVPGELMRMRMEIATGRKSKRDEAVRKLGYLKAIEKSGIHPREWVWDQMPILPPAFRPVSVMGGTGVPLVADANHMYREAINADKNLRDMKERVGESGVGDERLAVYHALKAVTGLGDPITKKSQDRKVKGILESLFGSSPKYSTFHRKLLGSTVDNVGRGTIIPDPDLDMDSVGIPEGNAFDVYSKHVVRRLVRRGMSMRDALGQVKDRTPMAREAIQQEMAERPVIINRAPVLHKFGFMAFRPQLTSGDAIRMPPLVFKGLGMDSDGDAVAFHAPGSEEAKQEALDRLLPSRHLFSTQNLSTVMPGFVKELAGALHHASTAENKTQPHVFRNRQDAIAAYRSGQLHANDPVEILT